MQITDPLTDHFRLVETQRRALKKLGLYTIEDLLFHFPARYESTSEVKQVKNLEKGEGAIVYGTITNLKTRKAFRRKTPIAEGYIHDTSGKMKVIWFHQPYIAKMVPQGSPVKMVGKVTGSAGKLYIANPEVSPLSDIPIDSPDSLFKEGEEGERAPTLYPIYPESKGITSKWFYHRVNKILGSGILDLLADPLPQEILKRYNLPTLKTALIYIHTPKNEKDAAAARKRFAFQEVFFIQIAKQKERKEYGARPSFQVTIERKQLQDFIDRFPFRATKAQLRAIDEIFNDFKTPHAMSRLLEGDVGSGKTAVAAATVYAITTTRPEGQNFGNLQTAYMVPTEILAKQHFRSFTEYFSHLPINIGLITSSGCKKFPSKVNPEEATNISRAQLLKWVKNGEIPILVGTHALIQKRVEFENLAYVIIDEQHRFGTVQRQTLVRKDNIAPHLLSMTATPIPRTLALTVYGDLDLTILDEMPAGRKPIITEIVLPDKREETYEKVRKELQAGRQVYVICPRIDEADPQKKAALNVKSVKEECARLKKEVFPEYEIEILHSKMRPVEKEGVMESFVKNEVQILVATSVVEVGVNVPNATAIIIEGAERFGLAQLHQLRGRVLRSSHQAFCFVFADTKTRQSLERLRALRSAKNGFELAEYDLRLRGGGELYGKKQWGLSDIAMEAIKNVKMVEAARNEAGKLIEKDPELKKHAEIRMISERSRDTLHFE